MGLIIPDEHARGQHAVRMVKEVWASQAIFTMAMSCRPSQRKLWVALHPLLLTMADEGSNGFNREASGNAGAESPSKTRRRDALLIAKSDVLTGRRTLSQFPSSKDGAYPPQVTTSRFLFFESSSGRCVNSSRRQKVGSSSSCLSAPLSLHRFGALCGC